MNKIQDLSYLQLSFRILLCVSLTALIDYYCNESM